MLPDLRIVIVAVLSTFVLTVGVGFYASSRLINEPKKRTDSLASFEETPVNRIALSWPAPIQQTEQPALDFAVTAKALRNPVRDVTNEPAEFAPPAEPKAAPVSATAADIPAPPAAVEKPAATVSTLPQALSEELAPARKANMAPTPEPEIRVAVQYPPVPVLPPELQTPVAAPVVAEPPARAAAVEPAEPPATTGSIAENPVIAEPRELPAQPDPEPAEPRVASRAAPADAERRENPAIQQTEAVKPAKKAARKKATPPKKVVKRPVRRAVTPTAMTFPGFFNFFNARN